MKVMIVCTILSMGILNLKCYDSAPMIVFSQSYRKKSCFLLCSIIIFWTVYEVFNARTYSYAFIRSTLCVQR